MFPITLPPLRERKGDIPLLLDHFVRRYASMVAKTIERIEESALELLEGYNWPGNIRELQNVVERAVILTHTETLHIDERWLRGALAEVSKSRDGLSALAEREVEIIEAALAESHGRISGPFGAATKLRMQRQTLESKIKRFGINKYGFNARLPVSAPTPQAAAAGA